MKYIYKYRNLLVVPLLLVVFTSCTTYLFEPVSKNIQGTWISDPVAPSNPDTWTFNSNGTCTLVFHAWNVALTADSVRPGGGPGFSSIFYEPGARNGGDTTLSNVPYTITSSTGRYYLTIDAYATLMGYATNQFRFVINHVNSSEMEFESQILYDPAQTGYIQIDFSKQ